MTQDIKCPGNYSKYICACLFIYLHLIKYFLWSSLAPFKDIQSLSEKLTMLNSITKSSSQHLHDFIAGGYNTSCVEIIPSHINQFRVPLSECSLALFIFHLLCNHDYFLICRNILPTYPQIPNFIFIRTYNLIIILLEFTNKVGPLKIKLIITHISQILRS